MTLEKLKEIVRQLIGRARTKEAINKIIKWAQTYQQDQLKEDATLIKANQSNLDRQKRLGLLSNSEASIKQNNINLSLIHI